MGIMMRTVRYFDPYQGFHSFMALMIYDVVSSLCTGEIGSDSSWECMLSVMG